MIKTPAVTSRYLDTVLKYYEEEIMGEAYFYGLADYFKKEEERQKLALLAQVVNAGVKTHHWPE
jgi:hypothetical protein